MRLTVIETTPDYHLVEPPCAPIYVDGEIVALPYRTRDRETEYHFFAFGSAAGMAIRHGQCPEAIIANCRANGHDLWWLSPKVAHGRGPHHPKAVFKVQQWGDVVTFHGRQFRLERHGALTARLVFEERESVCGRAAHDNKEGIST